MIELYAFSSQGTQFAPIHNMGIVFIIVGAFIVGERSFADHATPPFMNTLPHQVSPPDYSELLAEYQQLKSNLSKYRATIRRYKTGERYVDGSPRELPNFGFRKGPLRIPKGGTGQLIFGYVGKRRKDLEKYAEEASGGLVKAVHLPAHSEEARNATLFNCVGIGIDGLGRKITRYPGSVDRWLKSMVEGRDAVSGQASELTKLKRYLHAKEKLDRYNEISRLLNGSTPNHTPNTPFFTSPFSPNGIATPL